MASPPETGPYQVALEVFEDRIERLKELGEIRRPSQIMSEEEQDDHLDDRGGYIGKCVGRWDWIGRQTFCNDTRTINYGPSIEGLGVCCQQYRPSFY